MAVKKCKVQLLLQVVWCLVTNVLGLALVFQDPALLTLGQPCPGPPLSFPLGHTSLTGRIHMVGGSQRTANCHQGTSSQNLSIKSQGNIMKSPKSLYFERTKSPVECVITEIPF